MKDGFIRVCADSPKCCLLSPADSANEIVASINNAAANGVGVLVLPELALVGCTAGDIAYHSTILNAVDLAIKKIVSSTAGLNMVVVFGTPIRSGIEVYDGAVVAYNGEVLGVVPCYMPVNGYAVPDKKLTAVNLFGQDVPFGSGLVFTAANLDGFTFAVAVGGDISGIKTNASIILNPNSGAEAYGFSDRAEAVLKAASINNTASVASAFAGYGESTSDGVFAGRKYIYEAGKCLAKVEAFNMEAASAICDFKACKFMKMKSNSCANNGEMLVVFNAVYTKTKLLAEDFSQTPFFPEDRGESYAKDILEIQARALARRMEVCHSDYAVIGVSGGVDSTLALLVAHRTMEILGKKPCNVMAITMPCFGTTSRTKDNALALMEALGATVKTISIKDAVSVHLKDIEHPEGVYNTAYENAQARERTQVLMDLANDINGLVVGTGDLSELALGWATYNGDHMSMYGVNAGVSKTQAQFIIREYAKTGSDLKLRATLTDILDTEISPELLPPDAQGKISQKTEDKVGPYILHDFFLYNMLAKGYAPSKIYRAAVVCFKGMYSGEVIKKWLTTFIKRFFTQQFKRNCLPEGPAVSDVSLSPRGVGAFTMPSDASAAAYLQELEQNSGMN